MKNPPYSCGMKNTYLLRITPVGIGPDFYRTTGSLLGILSELHDKPTQLPNYQKIRRELRGNYWATFSHWELMPALIMILPNPDNLKSPL
jgi:hypothetical protein